MFLIRRSQFFLGGIGSTVRSPLCALPPALTSAGGGRALGARCPSPNGSSLPYRGAADALCNWCCCFGCSTRIAEQVPRSLFVLERCGSGAAASPVSGWHRRSWLGCRFGRAEGDKQLTVSRRWRISTGNWVDGGRHIGTIRRRLRRCVPAVRRMPPPDPADDRSVQCRLSRRTGRDCRS